MLSDQQIVVSSELPPDHDKTHLKLTGNEPWQPLTNSPMEWVQVSTCFRFFFSETISTYQCMHNFKITVLFHV